MNMLFEGKVALVTGGAAGIGLATARAFAAAGAAVVVADINEEAARDAADQLVISGRRAIAVGCDVAEEAQVRHLVEVAVKTYGRLDAAFNNAGAQGPATDTADLESAEFDRTIAVNLRGVWACMKYELQQMRRQGHGTIVNCSSIGGLVGVPGRAAYHAAKHGILGLTKSAALEYAAQGIRINAVCPGIIDTPMVAGMLAGEPQVMNDMMRDVPIGRLGQADEIASSVLWLCSPASRFVIGHSLTVDGGYTTR
jgi:NAD(P)-dependent dehydrogenase (short-subunit alcohol dehydrogenase family)